MQWAKYDVISGQERVKLIVHSPRKVKNWTFTDIKLYLSCIALREVLYKEPSTKRTQSQATQQAPSEGSPFKA